MRVPTPPVALLGHALRLAEMAEARAEEVTAMHRANISNLVSMSKGLIACSGVLVLFLVAGWTGFRSSVDSALEASRLTALRHDREMERLRAEIDSLRAARDAANARHNGFVAAQGEWNQRIMRGLSILGAKEGEN